MLKKIHSYLNFGIILLVIALIAGVFYSVLTYDPTSIIKDISAVLAILTPQASVWLDALIKNIDAIQQFYNIIFLSLFTLIMVFFIVVPLFNFFINRKKDLRISRLGLSLVIEAMMVIFIFTIMTSFVFDAYTVINVFGALMIVVILAQMIICCLLIYQWYKLAVERKTLGIQLVNTVGFLIKAVSIVLIIYFTTNIAIVLITNFAVETLVSNIHIAQMLGSSIVGNINFDVPLNELLPDRIVTFFQDNGFTLSKTLSDFGINTDNVTALLNSYVFMPIDNFIHNAINSFADRFIFRDFTMKLFVLATTIGTLVIYEIKIIPLIVRQIIAAIGLITIALILLFVLKYFLFINIIVIILALIVLAIFVLVIKRIVENDRTQELYKKEKDVIQARFKKGDE